MTPDQPDPTPAPLSPHVQALARLNAGKTTQRAGYFEVPVGVFFDKIDVGMASIPNVAIYVFESPTGDAPPRLLRAKDQPFSPLALSLHETVWVTPEDFKLLRGFAEDLLLNPKLTATMPADQRMEILRASAVLVTGELFEDPSPENISRGIKVVGSFVYVMMKEPHAYLLLARLSSHDAYTLQHSVGTAAHCIVLARKSGITDPAELSEVGMAGLLHDIGKTKVRKEIINKAGPLDEQEWKEMRTHSQAGYDIVKDHPELSERTKRAVLEHHEDRIGGGYPRGLDESSLHPFSRIVNLCDIFNALTTDRTYSKSRTPFEAFKFMHEKLVHKVDPDLFRNLVLIYGGKFEA